MGASAQNAQAPPRAIPAVKKDTYTKIVRSPRRAKHPAREDMVRSKVAKDAKEEEKASTKLRAGSGLQTKAAQFC